MVMSKQGKIVFGTLIGLAAGYVTGLLTAPNSGKDTRNQIKKSGLTVIREAEMTLKDLHSDLNEAIEEAADQISSVSSKGKKELDKLLAEAKTAQRKVKLMLNAIHDGEADDPDLEIAIHQAQAAKRHLSTYFRKSL
jgi:gas vesicle protein